MGNSAGHTKLKTSISKSEDVENPVIGATATPDREQIKVLPFDPRSPTAGIWRTPIQISESPSEMGDQKLLLDCQCTTPIGSRNANPATTGTVPASQRIGPPYYVEDLEAIDGVESEEGEERLIKDSKLQNKGSQSERSDVKRGRTSRLSAFPLRFGQRGGRDPHSPSDLVREKQRRECQDRGALKENNPPLFDPNQ